jgi:hypothetical protein
LEHTPKLSTELLLFRKRMWFLCRRTR